MQLTETFYDPYDKWITTVLLIYNLASPIYSEISEYIYMVLDKCAWNCHIVVTLIYYNQLSNLLPTCSHIILG